MTQTHIQEPTPNKPLREFRAGGVRATIWENTHQGANGTFTIRSVSFERRYYDQKTKEWKSTNTLRVEDVPKADLVLHQAYEYLQSAEKDDDLDV